MLKNAVEERKNFAAQIELAAKDREIAMLKNAAEERKKVAAQ